MIAAQKKKVKTESGVDVRLVTAKGRLEYANDMVEFLLKQHERHQQYKNIVRRNGMGALPGFENLRQLREEELAPPSHKLSANVQSYNVRSTRNAKGYVVPETEMEEEDLFRQTGQAEAMLDKINKDRAAGDAANKAKLAAENRKGSIMKIDFTDDTSFFKESQKKHAGKKENLIVSIPFGEEKGGIVAAGREGRGFLSKLNPFSKKKSGGGGDSSGGDSKSGSEHEYDDGKKERKQKKKKKKKKKHGKLKNQTGSESDTVQEHQLELGDDPIRKISTTMFLPNQRSTALDTALIEKLSSAAAKQLVGDNATDEHGDVYFEEGEEKKEEGEGRGKNRVRNKVENIDTNLGGGSVAYESSDSPSTPKSPKSPKTPKSPKSPKHKKTKETKIEDLPIIRRNDFDLLPGITRHGTQRHPVKFANMDKDFLLAEQNGGLIRTFLEKTDRQYDGHAASINQICFSHDERRVASCSSDHTIKIWDPNDGLMVMTLYGHADEVMGVNFSHDGMFLVSSGLDNLVIVWNLTNGGVLKKLFGHYDAVYRCCFSHNTNSLMSCSCDMTLKRCASPHTREPDKPKLTNTIPLRSAQLEPHTSRA